MGGDIPLREHFRGNFMGRLCAASGVVDERFPGQVERGHAVRAQRRRPDPGIAEAS